MSKFLKNNRLLMGGAGVVLLAGTAVGVAVTGPKLFAKQAAAVLLDESDWPGYDGEDWSAEDWPR